MGPLVWTSARTQPLTSSARAFRCTDACVLQMLNIARIVNSAIMTCTHGAGEVRCPPRPATTIIRVQTARRPVPPAEEIWNRVLAQPPRLRLAHHNFLDLDVNKQALRYTHTTLRLPARVQHEHPHEELGLCEHRKRSERGV